MRLGYKVFKIRNPRLRLLTFDIDKQAKELYLGLWFWLIVFYRSDVK